MQFDVLSIFPEMFESPLSASILKRAQEKGAILVNTHDIREFSHDKHKKVDDSPYGGGAGMVMTAPVLVDAIESVKLKGKSRRILLSPRGRVLTNSLVNELQKFDQLLLVCGRYEGVDERVMDWIDDEISIGDFVMSGGEIPALCLIDAVARTLPGVLGNEESVQDESHSDGLLEYPHYTRPEEYRGLTVPKVLLSGNHIEIEKWRKAAGKEITLKRRPDLIKDKAGEVK
jgi:tRNA (guanine37-N1)-methyltransferase